MKKILLLLIFALNIFADNYEFFDGWQMVGAVEDIEYMKDFENSCVEEVWRYNNKSFSWKKYILNSKDNTLTSIKKREGFWVKADSDCVFTPSIDISFEVFESGKKFVKEANITKKFEIIQSEERFSELYSLYFNEIPKIDFKTKSVVYLQMGKYNSNAYIQIKNIKSLQKYNNIYLKTQIPKKECMNETSLVPFLFATTQKMGNVIFNEEIEILDCEGMLLNNSYLKEIPFEEIDLDSNWAELGNVDAKRIEIIQDEKAFIEIYQNYINPINSNKNLPIINFENKTVIALFMGRYSTTGYEIEIEKIREYKEYIEVEVKNEFLGYGCPAGDSITSPVLFISIDKTDKEIIFRENGNVNYCN